MRSSVGAGGLRDAASSRQASTIQLAEVGTVAWTIITNDVAAQAARATTAAAAAGAGGQPRSAHRGLPPCPDHRFFPRLPGHRRIMLLALVITFSGRSRLPSAPTSAGPVLNRVAKPSTARSLVGSVKGTSRLTIIAATEQISTGNSLSVPPAGTQPHVPRRRPTQTIQAEPSESPSWLAKSMPQRGVAAGEPRRRPSPAPSAMRDPHEGSGPCHLQQKFTVAGATGRVPAISMVDVPLSTDTTSCRCHVPQA